MSKGHIYLRDLDPSGDSSLAKIARRISPGAAVLDLGTGPGVLGKYLKEEKNCIMDGVESHSVRADMASASYRSVMIADLETVDLSGLFPGKRYDYIVCADILEHLKNPDHVLEQLPALLNQTGKILLSVPNVAYAGLIADLLAGRFEYRMEGLLDATHLRFFTRNSLLDLLGKHRFSFSHMETVSLPLQRSEFASRHPGALSPAIYRQLFSLPDAFTYQFIVEASPDARGLPLDPLPEAQAPELSFSCELKWRENHGEYVPGNAASASALLGKSFQKVSFPIPGGNIGGLELHPADRPGYIAIHGIQLFNGKEECVWSWNGDIGTVETKASQMVFAQGWHGGFRIVALMTGDDPAMELPVPAEILSGLGSPGRLEVEFSWPMSSDYLALAQRFLDPDAQLAKIAELERSIQPLHEKNAALETQNASILAQNASLHEQNAALHDQNLSLHQQHARLQEAHAILADQATRTSAEANALRQTLEEIHSSTVWRYTRPLVRILTRLKGIR